MGAFIVKGASMLLSLLIMPAYMRYFEDNAVLGIWYTMLSVLTWISMFDLGIGNGLRNKLAESFALKDYKQAKEYISSAYVIITIISFFLILVYLKLGRLLNWSHILNISSDKLSEESLRASMAIIIYGVLIRFVLGLVNSILYAMQKSAINNLLIFITNLLIFVYVSLAAGGTIESNLIQLSYTQVLFSNFPLLVATIYVFTKPLKGLAPCLKHVRVQKLKEVLNTGIILLWLQVVAMIVLSTHAFLITRFVGPEEVVEYNIYYKVFNTIASIIVLALTPIWSAVTKAQAEKKYTWVLKTYKVLFCLPVIMLGLGCIVMPFLQWFFNIWLKESSIVVSIPHTLVVIVFCTLFVFHYVNTNVNNGLSLFKTQTIWMTVGAVVMIPLCEILCSITGNWTGVIIGCTISVLPYEIIQPLATFKEINRLM